MTPSLLRICSDGSVHHANAVVSSDTLYFVETLLLPQKTTPFGYQYYTCKLLDAARQPIDNNTFDWQGICCRLESKDVWASRRTDSTKADAVDEVDGIALCGHVTDLLGSERRVLFNNNAHNEEALRGFMNYVLEVRRFGANEAMREIWELRRQVVKQQGWREELKEKLLKAENQQRS